MGILRTKANLMTSRTEHGFIICSAWCEHFLVFGKQLEKQLETIGRAVGNDWKAIWKQLERDRRAIGKQREYYWKTIENFWQFLEQFLANYSNAWQHLVIYGISFTWLEIGWKAILKRIKLIGKLNWAVLKMILGTLDEIMEWKCWKLKIIYWWTAELVSFKPKLDL